MKKTLISGILLLTTLWLVATYFISKGTEETVSKRLSELNTNSQHYDGATFTLLKYDKGFFTSDARVMVALKNQDINTEIPVVVEHGPILFLHGLGFGASRLSSTVDLSETLTKSIAIEANKLFDTPVNIQIKATLNFRNTLDYTIKSTPLKSSTSSVWAGSNVVLSPLVLSGKVNFVSKEEYSTIHAKEILLEDTQAKLHVKELDIKIVFDEFFSKTLYTGEFSADIGKLDFINKQTNQALTDLEGVLRIVSSKPSDGYFNLDFDFHANTTNTRYNHTPLGINTLLLSYKFKNLKIDGILAFQDTLTTLETKQQKIVTNLQNAQNDASRMQYILAIETLQKNSQALILKESLQMLEANKSAMFYTLKAQDNSTHASFLEANATYIGPKNKQLLHGVTIDVDAVLQESLLSALPKEQQKNAFQKLELLSLFGQVSKKEKRYLFNAHYKPGKLLLNGNDVSKTVLPFLEQSLK